MSTIKNNLRNSETGRIVAGIILVVVGAVLLLRNMGFLFPRWLFSWPMILILVGIYTGVKHNFRNNSWIILLAIGGFFLINKMLPGMSLEPYFWPLIIIGAGVLFILRPKEISFGKKPEADYVEWQNTTDGTNQAPGDLALADGSDYLRIRSIFSGINRRVLSKNFQGAQVSCVFGGAEINFSQADITGPVIIKSDIAFGGVKLIVPPHWAIQNEMDGIFHGVDDKRRVNTAADLNPSKILILKGSVIFGGIEIRNS